MNASNIVLKDSILCQFVNLVYDNIDFKEDYVQQTHVTNGIIIQKVCNHDVQPVVNDRTEHEPIKKKQRIVALPFIGITPYAVGVKRTPAFDGDALDLTLMVSRMKNYEFASAHKLDLMYALVKIFSVNMEDPWPGWTGFSTLISKAVYLMYQ